MQYILHKLLIHINILLAFVVLFCSHSAYGQSGPAHIDIDTAFIDSRAVDLGLTVYWSNINVGQSGSTMGVFYRGYTYTGKFSGYPIENWKDSQNWHHWRIPSKDEAEALALKFVSYSNNLCSFSGNNNSISIPTTNYKMGGTSLGDSFSSGYMFWTSDGTGSVLGHYNDYYVLRYDNASVSTMKLPYVNALYIRPVIDKVTLTYKISESKNNTTSETFSSSVTVPQGTMVTLTATADECYRFVNWSDGNTDSSRTVTVTQDMTLTAVFTVKTTNVKVTTDSNKGWVGLNVWK